MTRALHVRSEAEDELADAIKWYESKTEGLGSEFLLCVDAVMNAIQREPESHPRVHKNIRRALVRRFPYGVFYIVEETRVVVLAVFHASRNPKEWQTRE